MGIGRKIIPYVLTLSIGGGFGYVVRDFYTESEQNKRQDAAQYLEMERYDAEEHARIGYLSASEQAGILEYANHLSTAIELLKDNRGKAQERAINQGKENYDLVGRVLECERKGKKLK